MTLYTLIYFKDLECYLYYKNMIIYYYLITYKKTKTLKIFNLG